MPSVQPTSISPSLAFQSMTPFQARPSDESPKSLPTSDPNEQSLVIGCPFPGDPLPFRFTISTLAASPSSVVPPPTLSVMTVVTGQFFPFSPSLHTSLGKRQCSPSFSLSESSMCRCISLNQLAEMQTSLHPSPPSPPSPSCNSSHSFASKVSTIHLAKLSCCAHPI